MRYGIVLQRVVGSVLAGAGGTLQSVEQLLHLLRVCGGVLLVRSGVCVVQLVSGRHVRRVDGVYDLLNVCAGYVLVAGIVIVQQVLAGPVRDSDGMQLVSSGIADDVVGTVRVSAGSSRRIHAVLGRGLLLGLLVVSLPRSVYLHRALDDDL